MASSYQNVEMATDHGHDREHDHREDEEKLFVGHVHGTSDKSERRQLIYACLVCFLFMLVELVAGLVAGSLAILTDAAHLWTDMSAFALAVGASYLAEKNATRGHSYGFKRVEVLVSLASTLSIWLLTGILIWEAVLRVQQWREGTMAPVNGGLMFGTACMGILVNLCMERILGHSHAHSHGGSHGDHGHGHGHGHGGEGSPRPMGFSPRRSRRAFSHEVLSGLAGDQDNLIAQSDGHDYGSVPEQKKEKDTHRSLNIDAAYIHVLGDLVQSIGVALAGLTIWIKPGWQIVDPMCTFFFALLVLATTVHVFLESIHVLLEGTPEGIDLDAIQRDLCELPGVSNVHDLHVWSLSAGLPLLTVHMNAQDSVKTLTAAHRVCADHGIDHATIQIGADGAFCSSRMCNTGYC